MVIKEHKILEQWDRASRNAQFPIFDGANWAFARARLTTFRSSREWIVLFELIVHQITMGDFNNLIYVYGNRVKQTGFLQAQRVASPSPDEKFSREGVWTPDLFDFGVVIKSSNQVKQFKPAPGDYADIGANSRYANGNTSSVDAEMEHIRQLTAILRFLSYEIPDQLFLPHEKLLELSGRSPSIPLFLTLYKWQHPDVGSGERPSDSICIRNLAKAISQREKALYDCSDSLINTHFSYWGDWPYNR